MKPAPKNPVDNRQKRCPRLGHQLSFSHCRKENDGLPCPKTLDCWFSFFPVEEYLKKELTPEQWKNAFEKPTKPKILSLVELIEQAQKRANSNK